MLAGGDGEDAVDQAGTQPRSQPGALRIAEARQVQRCDGQLDPRVGGVDALPPGPEDRENRQLNAAAGTTTVAVTGRSPEASSIPGTCTVSPSRRGAHDRIPGPRGAAVFGVVPLLLEFAVTRAPAPGTDVAAAR
ncbi:hypothetical protein [Blastococcus brunescens]|uniref:Uncharacterized protein n=1 Tax=Blastococcus brunescens TaxID=1564165 RepID=A0ABZ1BCX8_9ACTN|nr:hypothetical protein [Blastococcus sp. BMG 8361]WRL67375.1 hypothetical protein U6N30_12915 [Blastococcus sp. BMG 8361]